LKASGARSAKREHDRHTPAIHAGSTPTDIPGGTQAFTYTAFNLPKTITSGAGTTTFDYDGTEQRISKTLRDTNDDPVGTTEYFPGLYERRTLGHHQCPHLGGAASWRLRNGFLSRDLRDGLRNREDSRRSARGVRVGSACSG
jgi:YD repeat-containing protein